jgi:hypothetical protein
MYGLFDRKKESCREAIEIGMCPSERLGCGLGTVSKGRHGYEKGLSDELGV